MIKGLSLLGLIAGPSLLGSLPLSVYLNTARIAYYNEQDYQRAKKACLEGIEKKEPSFELHAILGGCEIGLGNWSAAARALVDAFALDSLKTVQWIAGRRESPEYYYQAFFFSAQESFAAQRYQEALDVLSYARPEVSTFTLKGAIFYKLDQPDQAHKAYQQALAIDPADPAINFTVGRSFFDQQLYDSCNHYQEIAIRLYEKKYQEIRNRLFQNLALPRLELISELSRLSSRSQWAELDQLAKDELGFSEGLAEIKSAVEKLPAVGADLAKAYYYHGLADHRLLDETQAYAYLTLSLEIMPDDPDALFFAGEVLLNLARHREAMTYFEKAVQLNDDDYFAWFNLAVCRTQLGDYQPAITIYENKVLVHDPGNIDALANLASLYGILGNKTKAKEYLLRVEQLQKK